MSCLDDYPPVTFTSIIMKCFEKLFVQHVEDPQLNCILCKWIHKMSSPLSAHALKLTAAMSECCFDKLSSLGLSITFCKWILDFLTNRPLTIIGSVDTPPQNTTKYK